MMTTIGYPSSLTPRQTRHAIGNTPVPAKAVKTVQQTPR